MDIDKFIKELGAEVVGRRRDDGVWVCSCGKACGTDMMLYMHRRYDHKVETGG